MRYADDAQTVAIRSEQRWNDGNALPRLREREQSVWRAALQQNIGFDVGETAGGVEQPANGIAGFQQ